MATKAQITKWGNSLAVRIPKPAADTAKLKQGDEIEVVASPGKVELRSVRKKPTIAELVRRITRDNRHGETEWGDAVGHEVW
ncbi:MAG TPA: AbrB/MazE/SpoVT family DNA-binding domain-containing protein [Terriglobales bacterium]|jgi:antitoxin MazE